MGFPCEICDSTLKVAAAASRVLFTSRQMSEIYQPCPSPFSDLVSSTVQALEQKQRKYTEIGVQHNKGKTAAQDRVAAEPATPTRSHITTKIKLYSQVATQNSPSPTVSSVSSSPGPSVASNPVSPASTTHSHYYTFPQAPVNPDPEHARLYTQLLTMRKFENQNRALLEAQHQAQLLIAQTLNQTWTT